jgi:AcrR family transcriptional regulator
MVMAEGGGCFMMKQKNATKEKAKTCIAQSLVLLMEKKSYTDISIGEITARAGFNRSAYYRNFCSKEDIIKFFIKKLNYEYRNSIDKNDSFKFYLEKFFAHYRNYKKEFMLIYKNGLFYLVLETLNDFYEPLMKDATISLEEQIKIYWYNGAAYNSFSRWVANEMRETPKELSDIFAPLLSNESGYDPFKQPFR